MKKLFYIAVITVAVSALSSCYMDDGCCGYTTYYSSCCQPSCTSNCY